MEQYISKSVLVAEIERRKKELIELSNDFANKWACASLDSILWFLDTLEVKEVDLEKEATLLSQKYFPDEENIWAKPNIEAHKCKSACIEIVEWLKAQKGE